MSKGGYKTFSKQRVQELTGGQNGKKQVRREDQALNYRNLLPCIQELKRRKKKRDKV